MARRVSFVITLTTDFGLQDGYVGSLRGAILSINPQAVIADISHEIPSFDIAQGAFVIGTSFSQFPKGSIHVGVVDPGVGSDRLPILIKTANYLFVGPDNGLFSMVPLIEKVQAVYHLTEKKFFRPEVSATFHGRDIFSPVAAHLSKGVSPHSFGPNLKDFSRLQSFEMKSAKKEIRARIVAIDKFGNAITNISQKLFDQKVGRRPFSFTVGRRKISKLSKTYSDVPLGKAALLFGSSDFLELALYQASIAEKWHLSPGQGVVLKLSS